MQLAAVCGRLTSDVMQPSPRAFNAMAASPWAIRDGRWVRTSLVHPCGRPPNAPTHRTFRAPSAYWVAWSRPGDGVGVEARDRMSPVELDPRGRRGFGHSQDRREVVIDEAEAIRDAAQRVIQGETLTAIVAEWNRRGIRTTTGGPWRINALSGLLVQPRLAGLGRGDAPVGAELPPPILDRETHEQLVAIRRGRRRTRPRGVHEPERRYLLTGFLRCWRCGSRLTGMARSGTEVHRYYRCPSRGAGGCSGVTIRAGLAEQAAVEAVLWRISDPDFSASVESGVKRVTGDRKALAALVATAMTGGANVSGGRDLWRDGRLDGQAWWQLKDELEARAEAAGSDLAGLELLTRQQELCESALVMRKSWDDMEIEKRRTVIGTVVDHFIVSSVAGVRGRGAEQRLRPVWHGSPPG